MTSVLFTNVRIIDGTGAQPYPGEVLVQGNRISRVGRGPRSLPSVGPSSGITAIDGAGATLMPGMVEAHTHFSWNDAANLSDLQRLPLEEHVLWSASCRQALPRGRLDVLRGGGVRQAAARRGDPQRHQPGPDPGPALPGGQPGDHGAGGARRRDAAALAVPGAQLRRGGDRGRRDAACGADVPQVRRRLDQTEPLGRQLHAVGPGGHHVDDRRGGRGRREGGPDAGQARGGACALLRVDQAVRAARHRDHLPRELHRRRGPRHARGQSRPALRGARHRHPDRLAGARGALGDHAAEGRRDGLRDRAGGR